jgi:superfamily I DNA/RNA helicase
MESAWYLSIGETHKVKHPTLQLFEDWNGVMEVAKEDADLRIAVKRVEEYGGQIPSLCEEVRSVGETSAERADVILSTVHKFKGMEAPIIKLGEDFPDLVRFDRKERRYKPMKGELCVFFVAVTRAMQKLYVNSTVAQLKTWKELLD